MLFDLRSGKRRRLVQVVYTLLAASFIIGFVIFGVGSNGIGGIGDLISGGGDDSGSPASQYQTQIDDAETALKKDPRDQEALLTLARYRFLSGQAQLQQDPDTRAVTLTEEARGEFEESVDAWSRYLKTDPKKPDAIVAGQVVSAYVALGDAAGAAEAQRVLAEDSPSATTYYQLAALLYANGEIKAGDEAGDRALAEASGSERKQVQKALDDAAEQARKLAKQAKSGGGSQAAEQALENPLGGLGTGTTGAPTTTP